MFAAAVATVVVNIIIKNSNTYPHEMLNGQEDIYRSGAQDRSKDWR